MKKILCLGDAFLKEKYQINLFDNVNVVFNLEYSLCEKDTAAELDKVVLRSDYDWHSDFNGVVKAVSLANNHMLDYGKSGLLQTILYLSSKEIGYFGAGNAEDNYNNPYVLQEGNKSVAFLGYCALKAEYTDGKYGVAPFDKDKYLKDIELCKMRNVESIIVYIHWGIEESPMYTKEQEDIAHFMIDNGSDCIIGQHSHCIQPTEIYSGKYIFYGIGNAIFPDFSVPAFYTDSGKPAIIFRKRQSNWNKRSLGVLYDAYTNDVSNVYSLYFNDELLEISNDKVKLHKPFILPRLLTFSRKLYTMFYSNMFIDGKLINLAFFKNEIRLKRKQLKGEKLK